MFDFCRSVAYCGTKQKNRRYVNIKTKTSNAKLTLKFSIFIFDS
jgi:hypothetical protein